MQCSSLIQLAIHNDLTVARCSLKRRTAISNEVSAHSSYSTLHVYVRRMCKALETAEDSTVQHSTVQHTVQHTVQYTVQYSTAQYSKAEYNNSPSTRTSLASVMSPLCFTVESTEVTEAVPGRALAFLGVTAVPLPILEAGGGSRTRRRSSGGRWE